MPRATAQSLVDTEFIRRQMKEIRRVTGQTIDEVALEYNNRARLSNLSESARYKARFARMLRHKWNYAPETIKVMQPVITAWNEELGIHWDMESHKLIKTPGPQQPRDDEDRFKPAEELTEPPNQPEHAGMSTPNPFRDEVRAWADEVKRLRSVIDEMRTSNREWREKNNDLENEIRRLERESLNGRPTTTLFRDALELTIGAMTPEERAALMRELLTGQR